MKGLSAIVHQIWELIEVEEKTGCKKEKHCPLWWLLDGEATTFMGNAYQGCTWIHTKNMNKSDADRKVAAEYVEKQYAKVQRSLNGLRGDSARSKGNLKSSRREPWPFGLNLPPSYNKEMGKHINWLSKRAITRHLPQSVVTRKQTRRFPPDRSFFRSKICVSVHAGCDHIPLEVQYLHGDHEEARGTQVLRRAVHQE